MPHSIRPETLRSSGVAGKDDRRRKSFSPVSKTWPSPSKKIITYCWYKSRTRSDIKIRPSMRREGWTCPPGLLMNDPPSIPDRRSMREATASCDPMYWSRVGGNWDKIGLPDRLMGALMAGAAVFGEAWWLASCLRSSIISRSISAFLLRFPTRLKLDSILQSRFRRWHLPQAR